MCYPNHQNNINSLMEKSGTECLNESDEHGLEHCLKKGGGYLESDCDEQVGFNGFVYPFIMFCLFIAVVAKVCNFFSMVIGKTFMVSRI